MKDKLDDTDVTHHNNEVVLDEKQAVDKIEVDEDSSSSSDEEEEEEAQELSDEADYADVRIPFLNIYQECTAISEFFLPGVPVRVKIVERIYQPASHRLSPNLYVVSISHSHFKWTIKRRDKNFRELFHHLELFRAALIITNPTMATRIEKIPKFPHRPDVTLINEHSKEKHMRKLQKFLQNVLNSDRYRNNRHTLDFMEVSHLSFIHGLGPKGIESEVSKRAGGHTFSRGIFGSIKVNSAIFHKRWFVVKNSFVLYMDKEKKLIRDVMLFDSGFTITCEKAKTGIKHGLMIFNNSRELLVKCNSGRQSRELMNVVVNMMSKKGTDWIREHRYNSFAPIRRNSWVKWYIDGSSYFAEVANAISKAEEEIFITDWWLSPELMLQRTTDHIDKSRLDLLLQERAENGVKIYVLLYKEIEMTLSINSSYSKKTLLNLHSTNIKVLRHPDHVVGNTTLLWAHHEKIVCIDQEICFLGGLDLCYGRWDNQSHTLTDFGSATPNFFGKTESAIVNLGGLMINHDVIDTAYHREQLQKMALQDGIAKIFIGKDYTNPYVMDTCEVEKPYTDLFNRNEIPRMPWHDIGCVVFGNAARDVARHFIQRWNYTKHDKAKENLTIPFLLPKIHLVDNQLPEYFDNCSQCDVQILRSSSTWSTGDQQTECSIYEAYKEHIQKAKYFIYVENQFFITSLEDNVFNKIGDAIIDRILMAFNNEETFRVFVVMPMLPSFPGEIGTPAATSTLIIENYNLQSCRYIINKLKRNGIDDPSTYICFCGLRTFADLRGKMVTEILYVHSKLLIIDDTVAIIGSANINDRSMLGSRDSELAICVQDTKFIDGVMNGKQVKAGQYVARLRRKLFQEHLGLLNEPYANVMDPISDDFYKVAWLERAQMNTSMYEQVFKCLPTNEVTSYIELQNYKKTSGLNVTDPVTARGMLKNIRGYLVEKPLEFLCKEDLRPPVDSKEALVPTKVFT